MVLQLLRCNWSKFIKVEDLQIVFYGRNFSNYICRHIETISNFIVEERTGLAVRALDSGSGDPGSILGRVGVLFP